MNSKGVFAMKSFYYGVINFLHGFFSHKNIGRPLIPSKVNFFMWTTFLEKILMLNHFKSRC